LEKSRASARRTRRQTITSTMKTKDLWFAVTVSAKPAAAEAIEFAFNDLDSLGTEIDSFGKTVGETLEVVGYFDHEIDSAVVKRILDESLRIYSLTKDHIFRIDSKKVENLDWDAEWKKHWKPTETEKFIIAPTWADVSKSGKILIRIDPKMAFGTGTHETTRLSLKAIEDHYKEGMSFLDVGTGTGILSIAVSKLSSSNPPRIFACDIDSDSISIAKETAELNQAEISFFEGSISNETEPHDFVCANVTADVIIPMLDLLIKKSSCVLILSGILAIERQEIVESLSEHGVHDPSIETMGEWVSVKIIKP